MFACVFKLKKKYINLWHISTLHFMHVFYEIFFLHGSIAIPEKNVYSTQNECDDTSIFNFVVQILPFV